MAEKQDVTTMEIKVDLDCEKCYKKIKKVLCEIPQIQNQIYDEKKNTVTIMVVCSYPEKIKKKIYCKGGKCVKCIKIIPPPPPLPKDNKNSGKDKEKPPPQLVVCHVSLRTCCPKCYGGCGGGPCYGCHGHGPCYGRPLYDSCGGGRGCGCQSAGYYVCRCDYVCEDNPSPCPIM